MKKTTRLLLFVCSVLFCITGSAQERYTVRTDPSNPKRKIVELRPVTHRLRTTQNLRNILVEDQAKRAPIPFQPFEMKHPKTGKPLNPEAKMTIKMPDGSTRSTTVKEFYAQVNDLEKQLSAKGRSLRQPNSLQDMKAPVPAMAYNGTPLLTKGFSNRLKKNPVLVKVNPPATAGLGGIPKTIGTKPIVMNPGASMPKYISIADWNPNLYIAESTSGYGTVEFPAVWVNTTITNSGRKEFPVLLGVPKGFSPLIKKIVWQLSSQPFDNTLKNDNPPGLKKQGTIAAPFSWKQGVRGAEDIANKTKDVFVSFIISLADIPFPPKETVDQYYIRAVMYNELNEVLKISPMVVAKYGMVSTEIKVPFTEYNTVPGFSYSFPPEGSDIPFGLYVKGNGLSSSKRHDFSGLKQNIPIITGYKIQANAKLGIRYFNFSSLVNSSEPKSKEFDLVDAKFSGIAGVGTSSYKQGMETPQGVSLTLNLLNGLVPPVEYNFTEYIPGTSSVNLAHNFTQSLDADIVDTRFLIGPVPIHINAGIFGEAGVELSGQFDTQNFTASGEIRPHISLGFKASGGVDAVIAYAMLVAEVNPLLAVNMPLTFSSTASKPLSFSTGISGLKGQVYLKAGFYYPCPSLEKIAGWLSGDEDLPLCECSWEYKIFSFDGFSDQLGY